MSPSGLSICGRSSDNADSRFRRWDGGAAAASQEAIHRLALRAARFVEADPTTTQRLDLSIRVTKVDRFARAVIRRALELDVRS